MKKALRWLALYWPVLLWLVPAVVFAQAADTGGLVPCGGGTGVMAATSCDLCGLGQLIQRVTEFFVVISLPIAAILLAIAGYNFFTSRGSEAKIKKGKSIIFATFVGFIIILSAWLLVQAVIVGLVNQGFYQTTGGFWNQLQCSNSSDPNLRPRQTPISAIFGNGTPVVSVSPSGGGVTFGNISQCAGTNQACSSAALQSVGFSPTQANIMSCIAMTESSGNPNTPNSSTGACGLFQITQGNWSNPAYHTGSCSAASSCNNAACNAQTAYLMFQQSGYQPWSGTCNVQSGCSPTVKYGQQWNPNASRCIALYNQGTGGSAGQAAALESMQP